MDEKLWITCLLVVAAWQLATAASGFNVLQTPWKTLEVNDKDRLLPWVSYESRLVAGLHFLQAPTSVSTALTEANYLIYSSQDPAYATPVRPKLVTYRSRVLWASLAPSPNNLQPFRLGYHAFLQLPSSLKDGAAYRFNVSAAVFGTASSFLLQVDEGNTLNTNIRVNQVGYPLSGPKLGFVGAWLGSSVSTPPYAHVALQLPGGSGTAWSVLHAANGTAVLTGSLQPYVPTASTDNSTNAPDLYTGQRVWVADFSALSTPGRYVLRIPGLGVSHAFLVSADALKAVLGVLARGVYGQRCGVALDAEYLSPWGATRPEACHTTDADVLSVSPPPAWMPVPNPTPNMTTLPVNATTGSYWLPQQPGGTRISSVGGHHDAGDYGKYVVSSGLMVGWLMIGLEVMGATHDNLPLPEAGDGIPDIMQEAEWELTYMEGMQDTDGGVYCVVKPNTTAGDYYEGHLPCGTPGKDSCNQAANDPRRGPRIAWPKDTTCTAQFAAAMARAARSRWFKKFRPAAAARYLSRAKAAWNFLATNAPFGALCYHFYGCMGVVTAGEAVRPAWEKAYVCYDSKGDQSDDERIWAAVELYAATGDAAYHNFFLQHHCPRYRRWGWSALPFSYGPATIAYAELAVAARKGTAGALPVNATMAQRCLDELAAVARGHMAEATTNPYRLAAPTSVFRTFGYGWHFPTEPAAHMLVAAALAAANSSEARDWRNLAAQQVHYILGANAQGFSLISGIGARRMQNIVDQESSYDDLDPAWPGLIQGITSGFSWLNQYGSALGAAFPPGNDYPAFHRISDAFNVNAEFTVPFMAQALGVVAALAGSWSPDCDNCDCSVDPPACQQPSCCGASGPSLPAALNVSLQLSQTSGPAPLAVQFTLSVQGDPGAVATIEWDFGDLGHSYQAGPQHTYVEPGRAHYGTVTVSFSVFTYWPSGAEPDLPPPAGLALAARLAGDAPSSSWGGSLPPLRVATSLAAGPDSGANVTGVVVAGAASSRANLAWQGPKSAWVGYALRPQRFEDMARYALPAGKGLGTLLDGAVGGLVLEAWLYVERFLSYGRGNIFMLGLAQGTDRLFGLQGSIWTGNQVVAGGAGVIANETYLGPRLTPGRWHHLRVAAAPSSASSNGSCSAWVDGTLANAVAGCSSQKLFNYCGANAAAYQLVVGGFKGYVDALRIYASPASNVTSLCGPKPPPPPPPAPPPSPAPDNRFSPITIDRGTVAVMDSDSACGLSGRTLAAALPLRLYANGSLTGTSVLPVSASSFLYPAGLSASQDGVLANTSGPASEVGNTRWQRVPSGCSLRVGSVAARNGSAGLAWDIPNAALAAARASGALSIDAKFFVEAWRTGYSFWNADVLGLQTNWDSYFRATYDLWANAKLYLATPAANSTRAFSGILLQTAGLEAALSAGAWHHVALTANATHCALAVDGVEVASGACNATRLLPAAGSAQSKTTLAVGGIRGWVDELRVSSVWRRTQRPGVPALSGRDGGCALLFNSSNCGSCAYVKYALSAAVMTSVKSAGAMTVDAKIWISKWVNYAIDNADPLFGWSQAWDRYFKITSDKYNMGRALVTAPSTFVAAQGLFGGIFVNRTYMDAALTLNSWHHVALNVNTTTCAMYVDGALLQAAVRCNITAMVDFTSQSYITVGGFQGYVADLRLSNSWRSTEPPSVVA
ncbi:hypothetical protein GPECTOR_8g244 [Gonium pectorale]|uniref:cellulase n=1 Tax=Gonium pectorale TaxID=33097 RepID=A0A150GT11_GONPE|nr:hypothetical protein GPECTOR_8g244 [Gonium pectorale]|eukprot:KXZ52862.1 hypothetical protein GPECTOR_8g244 [Gonium pectorale]